MYGPIFDPRGHSYYLNLCSKQHANNTCFDKQGHAIPSYACQVLPEGYSVDAGDMIAVYPLQDTPREGLVVTLFHGDKCASTGQGRVSNITMRCDPQAGAGYPEAEDPVEGPTCVYHFKWNTAYACPLCLPTDIETVVGGCIDGMQSTTYTYKRPVRCYGGTALPQPSQVACTVPTAFPVWAIVTIVLCSLVLITGIAILWKHASPRHSLVALTPTTSTRSSLLVLARTPHAPQRNLTLTHRYNLLKDQNENFRLSDLTSTALQDEEEPHRAQDESSHRAGAGMPAASPELLAASDTGLARSADV
ncbi:hypothetical protein PAPYR_9911 [Paratrimastix pyriformis]|uniref:MRH domain-containing protein n=1 Tax=Paratrimastix pyriformis TaxID=342808 RepID=A0ABQ8UCW2_9EUKA|nr:hypothetical protein PAPYR_9911 [Paratrimastix pyriformis]